MCSLARQQDDSTDRSCVRWSWWMKFLNAGHLELMLSQIYQHSSKMSFALLQKTVFDYFLVLFTQVTMCMSFRSWSLPSLRLEFSGWKRETKKPTEPVKLPGKLPFWLGKWDKKNVTTSSPAGFFLHHLWPSGPFNGQHVSSKTVDDESIRFHQWLMNTRFLCQPALIQHGTMEIPLWDYEHMENHISWDHYDNTMRWNKLHIFFHVQ